MTILVADVGGTNTRFALCDPAVGIAGDTLTRYRNKTHDSFESAVTAYLAKQGHPALTAICVAVAGPVSAGRARLTNLDWGFDADGLTALIGAPVTLINDLAALGHAVPGFGPGDTAAVHSPDPALRVPNGQALVLGLGTGVNACAVRMVPGQPAACLEAEAGHTSLPTSVAALLAHRFGTLPEVFFSTEQLFAGRGLTRLHTLMTGTTQDGEAIIAAHAADDPQATATLTLFATAVGTYARELALQYMPREGLYLAGS
ncbi:MAG: glucokinase, partial [Gemmobacter sp.]|nr:glucokinase [Gemmobacter sp.]